MKIRHSSRTVPDKVEMQMTPMIDIVFQLMTFFVFTFKIVAPEGDFNIKMPLATAASQELEDQIPIKVRLTAGAGGKLAAIKMNDQPLSDFKALHEQILSIVGSERGPSVAAESTEVELDCDYNLRYEYVVAAITAVSGYVRDGQIVKLVQKIKFAPPKAAP